MFTKFVPKKGSSVIFMSILAHSLKTKKCTYCEDKGSECLYSSDDSTRCSQCVIDQKSLCDARQLSPAQFRRVAAQHIKLEEEIEAAEEEHKRELERLYQTSENVERLRKQKKLWYRKMVRAVARGIEDVEELDRVERKEAERESVEASDQATFEIPLAKVISSHTLLYDSARDLFVKYGSAL